MSDFPTLEEIYRSVMEGPDNPSTILATQKTFFDILDRVGWTIEEMSELARRLEEDGKADLGYVKVFVDRGAIVVFFSIEENLR